MASLKSAFSFGGDADPPLTVADHGLPLSRWCWEEVSHICFVIPVLHTHGSCAEGRCSQLNLINFSILAANKICGREGTSYLSTWCQTDLLLLSLIQGAFCFCGADETLTWQNQNHWLYVLKWRSIFLVKPSPHMHPLQAKGYLLKCISI